MTVEVATECDELCGFTTALVEALSLENRATAAAAGWLGAAATESLWWPPRMLANKISIDAKIDFNMHTLYTRFGTMFPGDVDWEKPHTQMGEIEI